MQQGCGATQNVWSSRLRSVPGSDTEAAMLQSLLRSSPGFEISSVAQRGTLADFQKADFRSNYRLNDFDFCWTCCRERSLHGGWSWRSTLNNHDQLVQRMQLVIRVLLVPSVCLNKIITFDSPQSNNRWITCSEWCGSSSSSLSLKESSFSISKSSVVLRGVLVGALRTFDPLSNVTPNRLCECLFWNR